VDQPPQGQEHQQYTAHQVGQIGDYPEPNGSARKVHSEGTTHDRSSRKERKRDGRSRGQRTPRDEPSGQIVEEKAAGDEAPKGLRKKLNHAVRPPRRPSLKLRYLEKLIRFERFSTPMT
jgi:hypothetical protein